MGPRSSTGIPCRRAADWRSGPAVGRAAEVVATNPTTARGTNRALRLQVAERDPSRENDAKQLDGKPERDEQVPLWRPPIHVTFTITERRELNTNLTGTCEESAVALKLPLDTRAPGCEQENNPAQ
jgi:hypothetical protein